MSNRDAYVAKIKLDIDQLNAKMAEIEAQAKEARAEVKDKYAKQMDKLHANSKIAMAKLDEIQAASEDSWQKLVTEMEKLRDAFTHSFHYFKSQV
jgi:50S ribosomal subunit-associated GTPase HflX